MEFLLLNVINFSSKNEKKGWDQPNQGLGQRGHLDLSKKILFYCFSTSILVECTRRCAWQHHPPTLSFFSFLVSKCCARTLPPPPLSLPFLMADSLWNDVWTQVTSLVYVVRWKLHKEHIVKLARIMCYQVWAQCVLEKKKSNESRHNVCLGMGLVHLGTTCAQPKELLVRKGLSWSRHDMCSTKIITSHEVKRRFGWFKHDT